jgi:nucleoside-diphosphate-sugar epimerase
MKNINLDNKTILVTGSCGFIGSHLIKRLCNSFNSIKVIGIDKIDDYYDTSLKEYRLEKLKEFKNFEFIKADITDKETIDKIFESNRPSIIIHLAAQASARYSIDNPDVYIETNIIGFYNILEACKKYPVEHLLYASSSSTYGDEPVPYKEEDNTSKPVSLYAATKKCDEVLAYSYSSMYKIPTTGLRFFTVYGPAGRPDMAYFKFTNKLLNKEKIEIYNYGKCKRDFTYIDDIVEAITRIIQKTSIEDIPYNIYNIGNSEIIELLDFVRILEEELVNTGILPKDYDFNSLHELLPKQVGDVEETYSDTSKLERDHNFRPHTNLRDGLRKFAEWYKEFYK